ncbi:MAG TPA: hypothetical protein VGX46_08315, partial [Vicinamibacterales bacterium]|nr:hypothetical protein [Vicinamibacterales bacterium]
MKWILIAISGLAALVALAAIIGAMLPPQSRRQPLADSQATAPGDLARHHASHGCFERAGRPRRERSAAASGD